MTTINHPGTTGDEPDYEAFVRELEEWDRTQSPRE